MILDTNADAVAVRYARMDGAIRERLRQALPVLAQRVAAEMKRQAPKGSRSTLANSIGAVQEDARGLSWQVYPPVDYAKWVHGGRKPGKGLPRFFDPAAASIVAWLQDRIGDASRKDNPKWRRARVGSKRRTAAELELRDRYMALSRHVKLHGIKADPFVTRTAAAVQGFVVDGLVAAVRSGVRNARAGGGGGGGSSPGAQA